MVLPRPCLNAVKRREDGQHSMIKRGCAFVVFRKPRSVDLVVAAWVLSEHSCQLEDSPSVYPCRQWWSFEFKRLPPVRTSCIQFCCFLCSFVQRSCRRQTSGRSSAGMKELPVGGDERIPIGRRALMHTEDGLPMLDHNPQLTAFLCDTPS